MIKKFEDYSNSNISFDEVISNINDILLDIQDLGFRKTSEVVDIRIAHIYQIKIDKYGTSFDFDTTELQSPLLRVYHYLISNGFEPKLSWSTRGLFNHIVYDEKDDRFLAKSTTLNQEYDIIEEIKNIAEIRLIFKVEDNK